MIRPGGIEFTVTLNLPTSPERPFAHACIAAFAANAPFRPSGSDLPVMLITRPQRRSIICVESAAVSCRWRTKLSVMASSQSASLDSRENFLLPPALLTRMSTAPSAFKAASAIVCGAPAAVKSCSIRTGRAPPAAEISAATSSSSVRRRAVSARSTPSLPSASAIPLPIPLLAPVTSAVLPAISRSTALVGLAREQRRDLVCPVGGSDRVGERGLVAGESTKEPYRLRIGGSDVVRCLARGSECAAGRAYRGRKAETERRFGVELATGQSEVESDFVRDEPEEVGEHDERRYPMGQFGERERGSLADDGDVTERGETEAEAEGNALDCGDEWKRVALQPSVHRQDRLEIT